MCRLVSMIRVATKSRARQAPNIGTAEDHKETLLGVSGSSLAPDRPAERVAKGASGVLRPRQCRRSNFGVGRRQQFSHLLDAQVGRGIGDAGPVVEEFAV